MAVGSRLVENSAFFLLSTLLIFLHLRSVSAQTLEPSITITKSILKLKSFNDTFGSDVFIRCSTGSSDSLNQVASIKRLSINHKGEEVTNEGVLVVEATDTQKSAVLKGDAAKSDKYQASGSLGTSRIAAQITLTISQATCEDAGRYRCTMVYTRKGTSASEEGHADEYIVVAPFDFTVWRTPQEKAIALGVKFTFACTAVVGTLINDALTQKSRLEWVYRTRESAIAKQYVSLGVDLKKEMKHGKTEKVRCSEKQEVTLTLTVKQRDSLRDYFCVAAHFKEGGEVEYIGGGANTNITIPSFEKEEEKTLSMGGYVGVALGVLAMMSGVAFGVIWCKRRQKKKKARTTEIEARKAMIDERRKSITSIVEKRKSMLQQDASSAVETSTAEPEEQSATGGPEEESTVA